MNFKRWQKLLKPVSKSRKYSYISKFSSKIFH